MKKAKKAVSVLCTFLIILSLFPIKVFASEDKFLQLKVISTDNKGNRSENDELFLYKNDELYVSNYTIIKYTMYDYNKENNAFVRIGQSYKNSTSKIVIDASKNTVDVWSLNYHETLDCNIYKFNNYYFFPLAKIAAYLKASVIYYNDNKLAIISSGCSIVDAMYNFKDIKFMDATKIIDDLFYGDEALYKRYCILGYMCETVFNFKFSNIIGLGSFETYCDILESAVTNNDVYDNIMNNNSLLLDTLNVTQYTYEDIYKKISKVPKLSSSAITTMFEEYKEKNSFDDTDIVFDNFFESEELEILPVRKIGETISEVDDYLDIVNYLCDYFRINDDNRAAIEYFSSIKADSNEISAIQYIGKLYNNNFVKSVSTKLASKISEELLSKTVIEIGLGKIKLATSITNEMFKLIGFDLSDNSSYDIMLANDLKRVVLSNCKEYQTERLLNSNNSKNLRLSMIMTLLVEIEAYKMGNSVAKKTEISNYYDDDIRYLNKLLAMFYKAKESQQYDDFESIINNCEQNELGQKEINLEKLDVISQEEANEMLKSDELKKGTLLSFIELYTESVISFLNNNKLEALTDYGHMTIIDVNLDGYPDLTLSQTSTGGGHTNISNVYLYCNGSFEEITLADNFYSTFLQLAIDSEGKKIVSNGKPHLYNVYEEFYVPSVFGKVVINNNKLEIEIICDEYSETNSPKDYIESINNNFQFIPLSDFINFKINESNKTLELYSSENEIKDVILNYFRL